MVEPRDMFWALVLEDEKRYSQTVGKSFHISMAALELPTDAEALKGKHHQNVSVMVASQKSEFLICTLNFKHLTQQPLDLNFNEGEEVSFFINGQGTVHLTGYQIDDDKDFGDLSDFDEEEEESDTEVPQLVPSKKRKNTVEAGLPKKKTKWLTPGGTEFSDEDSDEDDEESDDDDMNTTDLLNMEADEDSDDDFDDEDEDDDDDDESDEEIQDKNTTPKVEAKKGQQTPKQEKAKEKQTPKPEQSKTPKQAEQKTPKQDKKGQDQKPGETPVSKLGAGGDAEAAQSGKKKKKKKKKKNKNLENGGDSLEGKMSQPNTPKPGQNTPKPGQNTPKPGQNTPKPGQNTPKPGQNTPKPGQNQQTPKNKSEQGKTPKKQVLPGNIIAEDIKLGEGQPAKKGKMAHVYYVGKLQKDGKQFDSCTNGKPFKFKLGMGEVIQGWEKGLEGMKVGGKRRLTVPPQQGYGSQRQGPIPPNSTLVFEVELKNVS